MTKLFFTAIAAACLTCGCMSDRGITDEQYRNLDAKLDHINAVMNSRQDSGDSLGATSQALIEKAEKLEKDHQALLARIKQLSDSNDKLSRKLNGLGTTDAGSTENAGTQSHVVYDTQENEAATVDDKAIVGAAEWVVLEDYKIAIKGRIDTGAATTSINALNIEEFERDGKKWVKFDLPDANGNPHKIEAKFVGYETIVQSSMQDASAKSTRPYIIQSSMQGSGGKMTRTYISIKIRIGNICKNAILNLANRSHMTYPILIGREFLKDYAVVDVGRKYVHKKPKADVYIDVLKDVSKTEKDYSKKK